VPVIFWRGADNGKFVRPDGTVTGKRRGLLELAQQMPSLIDAKWTVSRAPMQLVALEDHCRYKFLINIAGATYSARLKYLLLCGSTLLQVDEPHTEFFQSRMKAFEHFVPVKADWSDFMDRVEWIRQNPAEAERIGQRGQKFAREELRVTDVLGHMYDVVTALGKQQKYKVVPPASSKLVQSHEEIEKSFPG